MSCSCSCHQGIPSLGRRINARASLGARLVQLRAALPELEKTARRTPPKTLLSEVRKVEAARRALPGARAALAVAETAYARALEQERAPVQSGGATKEGR